MKTFKNKLLTIAVLLCSVTQTYAVTQTFGDWTSSNKTNNSESSNTYTFTTKGNTILSFDWMVSCEAVFDEFIAILDGTTILRKSGEEKAIYTQELSDGDHTLIVKYMKDDAGSEGEDCCKITNIKVFANPIISSGFSLFEDWKSTNTSDNSTSSHAYTFTTVGNAIVSFDWFVSSEANCDKLIVLLDGSPILTQSGEKTGTHTQGLIEGEHTLIAKYTKDSDDDGGSDNSRVSNMIVKSVEASGVISFADWTSTNKSKNSTSSKTYTFNTIGNAVLTFDWSVSSESADKLSIVIDGTTVLTKSGEQKSSFTYGISSGNHNIHLKYTKDSSDNEGNDEAIVSNIMIEDVIASGSCGENLKWKLYPNGNLSINGPGEMMDYSKSTDIPWYDYKDLIKTINLNEGISSVGCYAFYDCDNLVSIFIPESVTYIGGQAFDSCTGLTEVEFKDTTTWKADYSSISASDLDLT